MTLVKWDTVNQKGYFNVGSGICATVASGINSFTPEEILFTYIEVRTQTDTMIFDNQIDIRKKFKEQENRRFVWSID